MYNIDISQTELLDFIPDDMKVSAGRIPGRTTTPGCTTRPARSTPTVGTMECDDILTMLGEAEKNCFFYFERRHFCCNSVVK